MALPEWLQQPDYLLFALGLCLVLLGLFTPKKFVGFEVDWSAATSTTAVLVGAACIVFSYPQTRFWHSNTVNVDKAFIESLKSQLLQAQIAAKAAHDNSGDGPTCSARAGSAQTILTTAITTLDTVIAPLSIKKP